MKTLVIGLGNPILTDDGIGIYSVRALRRVLPPSHDVAMVELAVGGLQLMEAMIGYERVILVDALWSPDPAEAGRVMCFAAGDLSHTQHTASAHDVDLPTALCVGRGMGAQLPPDNHIQIIAIRAHEVLAFGDYPTAPVAAAIPEVLTVILQMLGYDVPAQSLVSSVSVKGGYDDFP
jgi:hydrogenase maturation protease